MNESQTTVYVKVDNNINKDNNKQIKFFKSEVSFNQRKIIIIIQREDKDRKPKFLQA